MTQNPSSTRANLSLHSPPIRAIESPERQFRLDHKVVILTGASSGIGLRFSQVLAGVGARQIVVARREERLKQLESSLPNTLAVPCDMAEPDSPQLVVEAAIEAFGCVDVVINNAGVADLVPAEHETLAEFESVLRLNLLAPFGLAQAAARQMISSGKGGTIVNVASILGLVALGKAMPQAAYTSSKAGLVNLTRELAAQWAQYGIRVNALCPGFFESEMTADLFEAQSGQQWLERRTLLSRGGREGELDAAMLLLASGASSYMTGQTLIVDGGWTAV